MKYFLIKANKGAKNDPFQMREGEGDFHLFLAKGHKDLELTLKVITPKGYRIRRGATIHKRIKAWQPYKQPLRSKSLFGIITKEIIEIDAPVPVELAIDYTHEVRELTHNVKLVDNRHWQEELTKQNFTS